MTKTKPGFMNDEIMPEQYSRSFMHRHLGPNEKEISSMLQTLGEKNLESFIANTIPQEILNVKEMNLPSPLTESRLIEHIRGKANKNKTFKNYIGQGYFECLPLAVTNRNIIKNPGWYTSYTPYQAELAQGRLAALLNFQTMVCDLTGMDRANASLLDEASACAEAMSMALNIHTANENAGNNKPCLLVDENTWRQTLSVLKTRADSLGVQIKKISLKKNQPEDIIKAAGQAFALFFQHPFADGSLLDLSRIIKALKKKNILILAATDLLANCLIKPPGELGADIVIGSAGRLGMPLMYGGPHAAFLAAKKEFSSFIPGRIVGVSKDSKGKKALRLALQTREQHIRRERATSNICTSQVLPAVLNSMYAVYHGPEGLKNTASSIHQQTKYLYKNLKQLNMNILNASFFDTISIQLQSQQIQQIKTLSEKHRINLGYHHDNIINISIGEGRQKEDMDELINIFKVSLRSCSHHEPPGAVKKGESFQTNTAGQKTAQDRSIGIPESLKRTSSFLQHPVFNSFHSETKITRYIHHLQNKDLSLIHSMIPLGSCTMKLNAVTELQPMTWKPFADIHPFAPLDQVQGSLEIFQELEEFLCTITGFYAFSLQPNAGSQGEYAGLLVFRKYHKHIGQENRNVCLIPASAHGTNPASAKMAGLKIVIVKCDSSGGVDKKDLKEKVEKYSQQLSCLMLTYPSTCGLFETHVADMNKLIHQHGGFVYFDGANMNALTGQSLPANLGFDAGHLNLHKTFCIPHGGGGPGSGPLGVSKQLKPFLPSHPLTNKNSLSVSATPYGNPGVLSIPWAYIRMMGHKGLKNASAVAILNANYIAHRLKTHYKILYTGKNNRSAHECIVDCRKFKYSCGIEVTDIAKRLMDYGFHSPTMSWPVPGTLMIEPTESEDKQELDRFCSAMIEIRKEIAEVEQKKQTTENNSLKNSPHTIQDLMLEKWSFPYSKQKAFFPLEYLYKRKFWPPVSRIDEAYGDRNLFCSCSAFTEDS